MPASAVAPTLNRPIAAPPPHPRAEQGGDATMQEPDPVGLVVAASFTAEPIESALCFWLDVLGMAIVVEFAPYNQVLAQLLDPSAALGADPTSVGVVLVRLEDWSRFRRDEGDEAAILAAGVDELTEALRAYSGRSSVPLILAITPPSPAVGMDAVRSARHEAAGTRLRDAVAGLGPILWLGRDDLSAYPVADPHDPEGDRIGHIPYTSLFFAALATAVARKVHAIKTPPHKVLALDCDNTLWEGVVGEDGPRGVRLPPGMIALQQFAVQQEAAGAVVCLNSKNVEEDVLEAFDLRTEMPLKREHIVAHRVNWEPKSSNLLSLAAELNLGVDSFVFLDDNPVEVAEVRASVPAAVTLAVPTHSADLPAFCRHLWAFDRLSVTVEDRERTRMYRENADRGRFERQTGGIGAFLAGLELVVDIAPPSGDEWPRVAQLTQKTNQFNFTTARRTEAEIHHLGGAECLRVRVADRFGDYGLVGVAIFKEEDNAVRVDTFLLSCRVLGRGVEHRMFADVGRLAMERGKAWVEAPFRPTAKNLPAAKFLRSIPSAVRDDLADGSFLFRVPADDAAALVHAPGGDAQEQLDLARESPKPSKAGASAPRDRSAMYQRIADELQTAEAVLSAVEIASRGARPDTVAAYVEPRPGTETRLAALWCRALGVDRVGRLDDFAALGGTSLKAALLFAEIGRTLGRRLPLTTILDAPTLAELAGRIDADDGAGGARRDVIVLRGGELSRPSLFLVHDGLGETLLYRNLALRLPEGVAVYGIEPEALDGVPIRHTRIADMAASYNERVRRVQPDGPYLLGGMCAGGTIAFEMALQLERAGHTVALVVLMDAADTRAERRAHREADHRRRRLREAMAAEGGSKAARVVKKLATLAAKARRFAAYQIKSRLKDRADRLRFAALRRASDAGLAVPRIARGLPVATVYAAAEREHASAGTLHGSAILLRATEGQRGDEPYIGHYVDPDFGWSARTEPGRLTTIDMPGGHASMLQEPHVAAMASALSSLLAPAPHQP